MKNKKILIAVIIAVVVIVVAVVAIFLVGKLGNSKGKDDKIKFEEENTTNTTENKTNTSNTNTTDDDEVEYDDDIPEYAKEATEKFVAALMDEDEMDTFIEENLDSKVYAAYDKVDGDDSKVMDEYANVTDDEANEITESFKAYPEQFKQLKNLMAAAEQMANEISSDENLTNAIQNEVSNDTENDVAEISSADFVFKLKKVTNFQESDDLDEVTRVDLVIGLADEEATLTMVFYDEIVVYIVDEDGESFLNTDSGMNNLENDGNTVDSNSTDEN